MPLSLRKLENLLASKGFVSTKFFELDGSCFYIELYSIQTADTFLLYIPSKYTFQFTDEPNVFKIKYLEMSGADNITDEYAMKQEDLNIEDIYGDTNIELPHGKQNLEQNLENYYKHPITLKDISNEDTMVLKAIYRQIKRFKYCVQNLKYKLSILYKNYICAIRRDDSIDCFSIKNYPRDNFKKLLIIVDLETFYEKSEKLIDDVQIVRDSIYKLLEKNQGTHSRVITKILENKKEIVIIPDQLEKKKAIYNKMTQELFLMLNKMTLTEQKIQAELDLLLQSNDQGTNIQHDITKAHQKAKLDKELDKINSIKSEIGKNIVSIREKRENKILGIDKISFDNAVMLDVMLKNFSKLKTILLE
jgi:predicted DNA-binding protein YlxM (UPF0122 family)